MARTFLKRASNLAGLFFLILISAFCQTGMAASDYTLSKGQTVYVPVYSNVFSAPRQIPFNLATILSIRNTNMTSSLEITSAEYFDTKGKSVRQYYRKPVLLAPLESTYIYIPEEDTKGGFGANFIVKWKAQKEVNIPIIECIMLGMKSGRGISFVSPGQAIKENTE